MDNILQSHVFDHFDKTYLLDRLQGSVFRITETVHDGARRGRYVVELDAAVLKQIQEFVEAPAPPSPNSAPIWKRPFFTGEQCDAMKRSYLKGVTSEALAVQYGCKAADIEEVLRFAGIAVVDQTLPSSPQQARQRATKRTVKRKSSKSPARRPPVKFLPPDTPWTEEEETSLAHHYRRGTSMPDLVRYFGRPYATVYARLQKLGLIK